MALPGVTRVTPADRRQTTEAFEVESEKGRDLRRDIARTIVNRGWGLLELRPMRMSLEEIFLQVTTEERPEDRTAGPPDPEPPDPGRPDSGPPATGRPESEVPHA
jgi:ABC-2 type transport system ATP-binding protein